MQQIWTTHIYLTRRLLWPTHTLRPTHNPRTRRPLRPMHIPQPLRHPRVTHLPQPIDIRAHRLRQLNYLWAWGTEAPTHIRNSTLNNNIDRSIDVVGEAGEADTADVIGEVALRRSWRLLNYSTRSRALCPYQCPHRYPTRIMDRRQRFHPCTRSIQHITSVITSNNRI